MTTVEPPVAEKVPEPVVVPKAAKKQKTSVAWNPVALRKSTAAAIAVAEEARGKAEIEENSQPWKVSTVVSPAEQQELQ